MRAVVVREFGPIASHRIEQLPDPQPGPGEVLMEVHAMGLNFPDVLMMQGRYQKRPECPFVPGRDATGIVLAVGDGVTRCRQGDRVMAQVFKGAFAERLVAPQTRCFVLPDGADFVSSAAMITAYNTAWVSAVIRAEIRAGETALVTGAAGGVGSALVQLLKTRDVQVIAAVSSEQKAQRVRADGADHVIFTGDDDLNASFRAQVEALTAVPGGRGINVAFDTVGGRVFDACLRVLGFAGRLVVVGFASGEIPAAKANYLLYNNLAVMGAPLDVHFEHAYDRMQQGVAEMMSLSRAGRLRPNVMGTFALDQFVEAFALIEGRSVEGKVVLRGV